MRTKEAIAIDLAQLSGLDHQRYTITAKRGLTNTPWANDLYKRNDSRRLELVREYEKAGGIVYSVSIGGCAGSDTVTNYDLDDVISAKFGDKVACDSESGGLVIDVVPSVLGAVMDKLNELDPDGNFSAHDMWEDVDKTEDGFLQIPSTDIGGSWPSMAKYLADRGIEQEVLDISDAPPVSQEQIKQGMNDLEKAIYKMRPDLDAEAMCNLLPLIEVLIEDFMDWKDRTS